MGLVCAALLIVTTRIGRRALVGFVALFTFLGFSNSDFIIGVPFLILAVWLLYRSYKVQKEASARLKAERAEGNTASGSDRSGRRAGTAAGRSAAEPRTARAARKKGPTGTRGQQALHAEEADPTGAAAAQAVAMGAPRGQEVELIH